MSKFIFVFLFFIPITSVYAEQLDCPEGAITTKKQYKNGDWSVYCEIDRNGKKIHHGPAKIYHSDGSLGFSGEYIDGKPHGKSRTWYKNGKIRYEEIFNNGELVSSKEWDENGKLVNN